MSENSVETSPFGNPTKIFIILLLIMFAFGSLTVAFFPDEYDSTKKEEQKEKQNDTTSSVKKFH